VASPLSGGAPGVGTGEELLDSIGEGRATKELLESDVEDKLWEKDSRPGSREEVGVATSLVIGWLDEMEVNDAMFDENIDGNGEPELVGKEDDIGESTVLELGGKIDVSEGIGVGGNNELVGIVEV
jgi:hypothetical protein